MVFFAFFRGFLLFTFLGAFLKAGHQRIRNRQKKFFGVMALLQTLNANAKKLNILKHFAKVKSYILQISIILRLIPTEIP